MSTKKHIYEYCLRLGDTSLIHGQRLTEWCGHGPMLEEDIAFSNIALDLVGQARIILKYAGEVEGKDRSEDDLAFYRDALQYRNILLAEQPNGDFASSVARLFFISVYNFYLYDKLRSGSDKTIAAFAAKSLKEVAYHVRHATMWMLRLGDGTEESQTRLQDAVNELWNYTDDMFVMDETDSILIKENIATDLSEIKNLWNGHVRDVMQKATLQIPSVNNFMRVGGKQGRHTEQLGYILAEMQFLPRAYPDARW